MVAGTETGTPVAETPDAEAAESEAVESEAESEAAESEAEAGRTTLTLDARRAPPSAAGPYEYGG